MAWKPAAVGIQQSLCEWLGNMLLWGFSNLNSFSSANLAWRMHKRQSVLGGNHISLTDIRHFWNSSCVNLLGEYWFIVVDVMDLDDEFRLGLYRSPCLSVNSLSSKDVNWLFLPVQPFGGLYVACVFIDNEEISCSISWKDIFKWSISSILVWM